MILSKCTSSECGKKFTELDIAGLKNEGKKISQNCPYCDSKLTSNVTEKLERKKWYGYLSPDKTIVEHLVLVVIDQFEDYSTEVEIPLLNLHLSESDRLSGLQVAAEAVSQYLMNQYGLSYKNDHQFVTVAFQDETNPVKHKVPVWW
jgi:DNA-directed RNA polymerase subunit RPC12/RpoP